MNDFDENDEYFSSEEVQELMSDIAEAFSESAEDYDITENKFINITDEDGIAHDFLVIGNTEYQQRNFVAAIPTDEEEPYPVIFEVLPDEYDEDEFTYAPVDEETFKAVYDVLNGSQPENEFITLKDENGTDTDFRVLGTVEYKERGFIVLKPEKSEEDVSVILELIPMEDGENCTFEKVEDDLLQEVFEKFKEDYSDKYDFQ